MDKINDNQLYKPSETAQYLGISTGTLGHWRVSGFRGPKFIKDGGCIRYLGEDIKRYIEERRFKHIAAANTYQKELKEKNKDISTQQTEK